MANIKEFLNDFAEKFGKNEEEKEAIKTADKFMIDYADGVFTLYNYDRFLKDGHYGSSFYGGHNGCIFEDEDYHYLWDNLIAKNKDFMSWLKEHNLTEKDMMAVSGDIYPNTNFTDIVASFYFYSRG